MHVHTCTPTHHTYASIFMQPLRMEMADLLVGEAVGGGATLGCGSAGGEHNLKPSLAKEE